ncbi:MAG: endonuclease MutS2 [Thomasclavelia sp.]|nr:endonuclease MutS2 [Thomasclavelia sp.]
MNNEEVLEFDIIKQNIAKNCRSELSRDYILSIQPYNDLDELQTYQEYGREALKLIYAYSNISLGNYENIKPFLTKIDKGGILLPEELIAIKNQITNVVLMKNYISDNEIEDYKILDIINRLYNPKDLSKRINSSIAPNGEILDTASVELARIRRHITSLESSLRNKMNSIKASYKDYLASENISSRDDHLVLPIKAAYKSKVNGIVHAVSATGQTLFIEPMAIVNASNDIMQARNAELEEINKILKDLTFLVDSYKDVLTSNQDDLVFLECLFVEANYGKSVDGTYASINEDYQSLSLIKAIHPLLDRNTAVANDMSLDNPFDVMLISGSNTGGKTVVLKTIGLLVMMSLSGLPITCKEASIPFFDNILVDIGDNQSIEESLSTFSAHMKSIVSITSNITKHSLVLIDEIGSGTDPKEGESLAQAIIEYLHLNAGLTVVSTHYSALKQFAKNQDYILVEAVEFDKQTMKPTYKLIRGSVGNSYAIEISKRLGLDQSIVDKAKIIKEDNQTESDKLLEKLQDELSTIELEKENLETKIKESNELLKRYNNQLEKLNNSKDKMLEEAKEEANKVLEEAKKEVDEVVSKLRVNVKDHEVIAAKRKLETSKHESKKLTNNSNHEFKIGDIVKVLSVNRQGEVVKVSKKGQLTIMMGDIKLNAKTNEVEYLHEKVKPVITKSGTKSIRKTTTGGSYELNIIGQRYEEAMINVDKFLDDAIVNNYSMVRIVHGMGTGVLRNGVHNLLDKNKNVVSYRDGGPNEGGLGATLVYFE